MKSICILVQAVYDFDARVRRKAEALAAEGYVVDVLALRPPDGRQAYTLNGVNVETVRIWKKRGSRFRYLFEYAAFFAWAFVRVGLLMRRRQYAVIDVNTLPDFLIFAPILARWMGAKLLLDMHEITPEFYQSKYGMEESSRTIRILKYLEKRSFEFADHVITITEPIRKLLVERGLDAGKTSVIMNAVDESRFASILDAPVAANAVSDKFVMMYHGTLTPIYGLDVAVEAFGIAHQEMPAAEMWILGSGPELEPLLRLAERRGVGSKVKMIGQVAMSEIPGWLTQCQMGILPFRRDVFLDFAFPNKLAEFIVMGKVVVISRLNTIQSYFSEDALAYFEPNSSSDLARQMVRLYRDRPLGARLAETAKQEYAPIRWQLMKERYLNVVEALIDPGTRRQLPQPERRVATESNARAVGQSVNWERAARPIKHQGGHAEALGLLPGERLVRL